MIVDHLFIVTLTFKGQNNQTEVIEDAKALYARYGEGGAKQHNVRTVQMVEFHSAAVLKAEWAAERLDWKDGTYGPVSKPPSGPRKDATVGVYVVGHGSGGHMDSPPEELADVLLELAAPGLLKKVVLLVCEVGKGIDSEAKIEWGEEHHDVAMGAVEKKELPGKSGPYTMCTLLTDEAGNSPMVAGWDDFVSVCYGGMSKDHQPNEIRKDYAIGTKGKMNDKGLKNALGTEYVGRKTVEAGKKKVLPDADVREAHKVIYVAEKGIIYRRHPSFWSDKGVGAIAAYMTDNNNEITDNNNEITDNNNVVGKEEENA